MDSGTSSFSEISVWKDSTGVVISIEDDNRDLRKVKIANVSFIDSKGKYLQATILEQRIIWTSKEPYHSALMCAVSPQDKNFDVDSDFKLKLTASDGTSRLGVDGKFSTEKELHAATAWEIGR